MIGLYIPSFLYVSLGIWLTLLIFFLGFLFHVLRLPDDEILRNHAAAIENKRRLGIKVFKF